MRLTPWILTGVFATLALISGRAEARDAAAQPLTDYTMTSWSRRDGIALPIWSICQDQEGYLWIGTGSGLARFDGHRFATWESLGHERLPASTILALLAGKDGSLWIGAGEAGIGRFLNGTFSFYRDPKLAFTRTLFQDRRGAVWAGSRSGVYLFDGTRWVQQDESVGLPNSPNSGIYEDASGALWVRTLQGTYRREPSGHRFERAPSGESLPSGALRDHRGDLWLPSIGQGLTRLRAPHGARAVEHVTAETGLSSNVVGAVYEDRDSNIWIGTQAALHELSPRKLTPVANLGAVTMVKATPDGATWFGSNDGLVRITRDGRHMFTEQHGLPARVVRALATDRTGHLWIATDRGLARFVDGHFVTLAPKPPGRFGRITAFSIDSSNTVWLTDFQFGIMRLRDGVLTPLDTFVKLAQRPVYAYADSSDRVWLGFGDGQLGLLTSDGRVSTYATGLTAIGGMSEDREGVLWIGGGNGIARFANGRAVAITTTANGLPGERVRSVIADARGAVWAGTGAGILRLDRSEFDAVEANPRHRVRSVLYDETDGLLGMPSGLASPSASLATDGKLWFITEGGATVVDPASLSSARRAPRVRVEAVRAAGTTFDPAVAFRLAPRPERVDIDYTALTFLSPQSVTFRYRLSGFDSTWQEAGNRRQATYTNLPPGTYTFQVTAHDKEGSFDPAGAVMRFSIAPAFDQTAWFVVLIIAVTLALGTVAWWIRVRQIRERFSLVLVERARIGREVHDTLLQSLVGVALRTGTVARRLPASDPTGARQELNSLRRHVEEQIREVRQTIWNLRSPTLNERGLAGAIEHAGDRVAEETSAAFTFSIIGTERPYAPAVEEQLLRIAQEALFNASRHSDASVIRAELEHDESRVTLRIIDNGVGFDVDAPGQASDHFGLTHMRERAGLAGGHVDVISAKGSGTQVIATFPANGRGAA
ncbi:MAG: two-component regulator propeller domain-containing protein [Vicinamibacterales bacterium]